MTLNDFARLILYIAIHALIVPWRKISTLRLQMSF